MAIADGPVIVGGGPSGLAAAIELRELGISPVTVIEREREAGGIPRHSDHTGFGLRDLRTVLSGPRYAAALSRARGGGRRRGPHRDDGHRLGGRPPAEADRAGGRLGDRAAAPWSSRPAAGSAPAPPASSPGSRPAGVMTTSTLQQLVHLRGPEGGAPGGDRRRRARQLLRGRDARARGRLGGRAGHRAPQAPVADAPSGPARRSATGRRSGRGRRSARSTASERVESVELTELDSGPHPDGRMRPGRLHRGLDPGPRAGGDGRLRARSRHPRPTGRSRRCGPPGRACSRPGTCCTRPRPPTSARSTAATSAPAVAAYLRGPGEWPSHVRLTARAPARLGRARTSCWRAGTRRRATASCCARASSSAAPGFRSARAAASCGVAGSAGWCPGARRTSPPAGPPESIPIRRPRDRLR